MAQLSIVPPTVRKARVLAVFGPKGGITKTTTATHIGTAMSEMGKRVLLVDTDPQRTLIDNWYAERIRHPNASELAKVDVGAASIEDYDRINRENAHYDLIVYDMAPGIEGKEVVTKNFLQRVHHCIMPCTPSPYDWKIVKPWMHQMDAWGVKASVLLTKYKKNTRIGLQAKSILGSFDIFPIEIPDTTEIPTNAITGTTACDYAVSKCRDEFMILAQQVARKLEM